MHPLLIIFAILAIILTSYLLLRGTKYPTFSLVRLERTEKGWRGEVEASYLGKKYPQVWVSQQGLYWHNVETLQTATPSNWGGSGDAVADLLADAVERQEVAAKVADLTDQRV